MIVCRMSVKGLIIFGVFFFFCIFGIISYAENMLLEIIYSFQNATECTNLEGDWDQTCLETRKITNQAVQILKVGLSLGGSWGIVKMIQRKLQ